MLTAFCIGLYILVSVLTFVASMIAAPVVQRRVSSYSFPYAAFDFEFPGPYVLFLAFWPIGWVVIGMYFFVLVTSRLTSNLSKKLEKLVSNLEKRV